MLRLKANKTSLYKLVAGYVDDLPPLRTGTEFTKYPRTPGYALEWITKDWKRARALFSTSMGRPLLSIEIRDDDGNTISRVVHKIAPADLQDRGMAEEFTTAAERRRLERSGGHSGLIPTTKSAV